MKNPAGTRIVLYNEFSLDALKKRLDSIPLDGSLYFEFGKVEENRRAAQRRLEWLWYTVFGEFAGYTKDEAHDLFCREINGVDFYTDRQGNIKERVIGNSKKTVLEMVDFLTQLEVICTQIGCMLPMPEDYYQYAMMMKNRR